MGASASTEGIKKAVDAASPDEMKAVLAGLPQESVEKLKAALSKPPPSKAPSMPSFMSTDDYKLIPAVLDALKQPRSARSVLNYMMACDTADPANLAKLSTDAVVGPMMGIWFAAGTKLDAFCQPFVPVIKELAAGTLSEPEWDTTEGRVAKVLLGDQLSRSCFRGTSEAFSYDPFARDLVRGLVSPDKIEETLNFPCGYLYLLPWALAHSEDLADLTSASELLVKAIAKYPDFNLFQGRNRCMIEQHRAVVAKFGRYPHRNKELGRDNTPEEQAWLDDKESCPGWAGNGASWNCAAPEWLEKFTAMLAEGKLLPASKPKEE